MLKMHVKSFRDSFFFSNCLYTVIYKFCSNTNQKMYVIKTTEYFIVSVLLS